MEDHHIKQDLEVTRERHSEAGLWWDQHNVTVTLTVTVTTGAELS